MFQATVLQLCKVAKKLLSFVLAFVGITHYTPGIYADRYIVFAFPFVCSLVRWFVSSVKMSKFWLKFLCWCISHELNIRNHSYLDYRYPIGLALFL